ncbi:MAG TPA: hypothetical protein VM865_02735, partial [Acidobacteriaceae bacterium]|nr:hypothetical protein [Acidobacteriaceae bacterium]
MTVAQANQRIAGIASQRAVHAAFRWLHLHAQRTAQWHRELIAIPSPPFAEAARAAWFLTQFAALG